MLFTEELRKCLNAAGLSDCGENDAWNYWYQRVLKAHNEAVERQIATEQAENEKLRELCADLYDHAEFSIHYFGDIHGICDRMRELGVDV